MLSSAYEYVSTRTILLEPTIILMLQFDPAFPPRGGRDLLPSPSRRIISRRCCCEDRFLQREDHDATLVRGWCSYLHKHCPKRIAEGEAEEEVRHGGRAEASVGEQKGKGKVRVKSSFKMRVK